MADKAIKDMSFEEALAELESVVGQLEGGNSPLDASIQLYERGAELRAHCEKKLASAEEKVAQITKAADGSAAGTAPVDPE